MVGTFCGDNVEIQHYDTNSGSGESREKELEGYGCSKVLNNVNGIARSISTIPRRPFRTFWAVPSVVGHGPKGTSKEKMLELVVSTTVKLFPHRKNEPPFPGLPAVMLSRDNNRFRLTTHTE